MKPVLIVEGKQLEVSLISWHNGNPTSVGIFDENGNYQIYHDTTANEYIEAPLKIELSECLKWQGRYEDLHKEIQKEIDSKESQMTTLAIENMHNELPFTPNEARKKYFDLLNQQVGLMDAQEVIELFMDDDVDLSGGEEDEAVQRMQQF